MEHKSEIVIYRSKKGNALLDVKLENDSVWLTQKQIAGLFGTQIPAISKHIDNILKTRELIREGTVSKMEIVHKEGDREVKRELEHYNLDMIVAVGYRVNSYRATQFRIWATNVLKNHIINGFSANPKRLEELEKQFERQKESLERLRYLTNEFMIKTARRDVLNTVIEDVEQMKSDLKEIRRNIEKLSKTY